MAKWRGEAIISHLRAEATREKLRQTPRLMSGQRPGKCRSKCRSKRRANAEARTGTDVHVAIDRGAVTTSPRRLVGWVDLAHQKRGVPGICSGKCRGKNRDKNRSISWEF